MPRWLIALCLGGSAVLAFACNDETVEEVDSTVCYSGMRWVGEKRGSPEMFPGRDCVGCHLDNDGPPLAIGGTIYPYVLSANAPGLLAQTGTDCFGIEGVTINIEDGEGQPFNVVTNRAGNFYVEGNPDDFAKPVRASITWINPETGLQQISAMNTPPEYGGCGRCHNPAAVAYTPVEDVDSGDKRVIPIARIGLPGYGPGLDGEAKVEDYLTRIACTERGGTGRDCDRLPPDPTP